MNKKVKKTLVIITSMFLITNMTGCNNSKGIEPYTINSESWVDVERWDSILSMSDNLMNLRYTGYNAEQYVGYADLLDSQTYEVLRSILEDNTTSEYYDIENIYQEVVESIRSRIEAQGGRLSEDLVVTYNGVAQEDIPELNYQYNKTEPIKDLHNTTDETDITFSDETLNNTESTQGDEQKAEISRHNTDMVQTPDIDINDTVEEASQENTEDTAESEIDGDLNNVSDRSIVHESSAGVTHGGGGRSFNVPKYASGEIALSPQIAEIGHGREDVIPLDSAEGMQFNRDLARDISESEIDRDLNNASNTGENTNDTQANESDYNGEIDPYEEEEDADPRAIDLYDLKGVKIWSAKSQGEIDNMTEEENEEFNKLYQELQDSYTKHYQGVVEKVEIVKEVENSPDGNLEEHPYIFDREASLEVTSDFIQVIEGKHVISWNYIIDHYNHETGRLNFNVLGANKYIDVTEASIKLSPFTYIGDEAYNFERTKYELLDNKLVNIEYASYVDGGTLKYNLVLCGQIVDGKLKLDQDNIRKIVNLYQ